MVNVSGWASADAYRQLCKQPDSSRGILSESNKTLEEKVTICHYKETATHSSILAQEIPMDRGAWWATVQRVTEELEMT